MYKVYFENSNGKIKKLGEARYQTAALALIKDFLNMHNFKSYYYNIHIAPFKGKTATNIDVGSHTEFFYVSPPLDEKAFMEVSND